MGYKGVDMGRFRGSKVGDRVGMDADNESYILWLRFEDPFCPNASYVEKMWEDRGVILSESTVSRWFNHRFAKKATGVKANIVPIDKFRPGNILNYAEFCSYVKTIDPQRPIFTDEIFFEGGRGDHQNWASRSTYRQKTDPNCEQQF